jgi:hypothetical protein
MRNRKTIAGRKGKRATAKRRGKLRRWEASEYLSEVHGLKYAPATLAKYACAGTGPSFQYFNDWIPIYTPAGLDRWVKSYLSESLSRRRTHTRKRSRKSGQSPPQATPPPVQHDLSEARAAAAAPSRTSVKSAQVSA